MPREAEAKLDMGFFADCKAMFRVRLDPKRWSYAFGTGRCDSYWRIEVAIGRFARGRRTEPTPRGALYGELSRNVGS
jgi:hypothetical protein